MVREIVMFGSQILRQKSAAVTAVDEKVHCLVADLFDSMRQAEGVGLAAPQIGVARQVVVVDVSAQDPQRPAVALVNPQIVGSSGSVTTEEGCLSLPELFGDVERHAEVEIKALGINGQVLRLTANGFYARVLQHEIDHLEGRLFVDHMSPLKRQLLRGNLKRLKKIGERWDRENLRKPC